MSWPDWWPGCTLAKGMEVAAGPGASSDERLLATTATLNFKAFLGYTLSVSYHPTLVDSPNEIAFAAGGDLAGEGRVTLTALSDDRTQMVIEWRVRPTNRWMTFLSPVARPAFTYAHATLMRRGEEGLRNHLAMKVNRE